MDNNIFEKVEQVVINKKNTQDEDLKKLSEKALKIHLTQSIENENYEQASQIRDELKTRKKHDTN